MRATYQANTEKLVYNCRVLAERAQESTATLSQQKRRLSRQRDVLLTIKVCPEALWCACAAKRRAGEGRVAGRQHA